jgi:hypothetical protein
MLVGTKIGHGGDKLGMGMEVGCKGGVLGCLL